MPENLSASLQQKIEERLRYYQDLGIQLFYRDRLASPERQEVAHETAAEPRVEAVQEPTLPKREMQAAVPGKIAGPPVNTVAPPVLPAIRAPGPSLFDAADKVQDDTLLKIRDDIGPDCTRCKLHKGRNKIVFGDGNPKAELVFIGEGPGADEDIQGLPFVGRAGKLLTQMIEAMGLQRQDVYICNVVKCRPPENRLRKKTKSPNARRFCCVSSTRSIPRSLFVSARAPRRRSSKPTAAFPVSAASGSTFAAKS